MRKAIDDIQNHEDKDKIISFLTKNDNELAVPVSRFPWWIEWTVQLLSEKGKILIAEHKEDIIWLLLMTFWEPSKNYENQEIWYLYLLMIETNNRRKKWIIIWFFQKVLEEMKTKWIKKIRFKADATVDYNNNLYKKIAKVLYKQQNTQWIDCNLYEADVDTLYQSIIIEHNFRPLLQK